METLQKCCEPGAIVINYEIDELSTSLTES